MQQKMPRTQVPPQVDLLCHEDSYSEQLWWEKMEAQAQVARASTPVPQTTTRKHRIASPKVHSAAHAKECMEFFALDRNATESELYATAKSLIEDDTECRAWHQIFTGKDHGIDEDEMFHIVG